MKLIELTNGHTKRPVSVNVENIITVSEIGKGTAIRFCGNCRDYLLVLESAQTIARMDQEADYE